MPFKSRAQRRKFAELLVKGEIAPETFEEWNRATGSKTLPERVNKASKSKRKATGKTTRRSTVRANKKSRKARPTARKR